MELLIDNYRGIVTSVVRKHLGVLINYEINKDIDLELDNRKINVSSR